jgi:long-subunit fatty acid transport protein
MTPSQRKDFLDNNIPYQLYLADTSNGYLFPSITDSLQQTATIMKGGGLNHWSFGGALDIAPDISLGVSFNFVSGSYSYDRQYVESNTKNVYRYLDFDHFAYSQNVNDDLTGFNLLIGLMYRKPGKFRVGFTLRTPTHFDISETSSKTYESTFTNGDVYSINYPQSNEYNYKIVTPMVLSVGASIIPVQWLTLGMDAEYTDWTELEFDSNDPNLRSENLLIKSSLLRAVTNIRGGGEIALMDYGIKLRGGIVWNPSPYKMDANTTDYDRIYYTTGAGFIVDQNTSIDLSYSYGFWKWSRSTKDLFSVPQALATSESVHTNNLNITLTYRF